MPGFYYYLPNLTSEGLAQGDRLNREVLAERGLADVLADVTHVPRDASLCQIRGGHGPDGKSGLLLAICGKYSGAPEVVSYLPDKHPWRWEPIGDGARAWLGVLTNGLPRPADLERRQQIGGAELLDDHGCVWRVPIARSPEPDFAFGALPQSFAFDAAGEPVPAVLPQWAWLWELSGEIRDAYAGVRERTTAWLVKAAARILGVNYRLGPAELSLLHSLGRGLLTQATVHAIGQACYGFEVLDEAKKNWLENPDRPAGSSSCSPLGEKTPPASPGTGPVGAA